MAKPLTDSLIEKMALQIRLSGFLVTAASLCDVDMETALDWLQRGKEEAETRVKFFSDAQKFAARKKAGEASKEEIAAYAKMKKKRSIDRRNNTQVFKFRKDINRALSSAEAADIGVIAMASRGKILKKETATVDKDGNEKIVREYIKADWNASAWLLERRNNERWGKQAAIKISGDADKPLKVLSLTELSKQAYKEAEKEKKKKKSKKQP